MFEDFSFSSPSSSRPARLALDGDDRLMLEPDSALISPMSSRCPSPRSSSAHRFPRGLPRSRSSYFRSPPPPPTSVPYSAYNDHKRLSIGTLTRKLHEHTIQNTTSPGGDRSGSVFTTQDQRYSPVSPGSPHTAGGGIGGSGSNVPGYFLTPPDTDTDTTHDDEGFVDTPSSLLTSPSLSPQPQSPFLSPTSAPAADYFFHNTNSSNTSMGDLEPPHQQDIWSVRAHRQQISRLQCNPSDLDAIRRAILSDEHDSPLKLSQFPYSSDDCHPSSLPPQISPRRRAATLHSSGSGSGSGSSSGSNSTSSSRTRYRPHTGSGLADTYTSSSATGEPSRRRKSSGSGPLHTASSSRIEKSYHHVGSAARDRDLRRKSKSEQGLRRKSLVSAALASMVEN